MEPGRMAPGSPEPDPVASARLQALVAGLYQLTVDEFEYVLGTFPLVGPAERDAALAAHVEAQR